MPCDGFMTRQRSTFSRLKLEKRQKCRQALVNLTSTVHIYTMQVVNYLNNLLQIM